jgi:hypothetical protein
MSFIKKSGDVVKCRLSISRERKRDVIEDKNFRHLNLSFDNKDTSYNRKFYITPKFKDNANKKKTVPLPKQPKNNTIPIPKSKEIRPNLSGNSEINTSKATSNLSIDLSLKRVKEDLPFPVPLKITKLNSKDSCSTTDSKRRSTPKLMVNHPSFKSLFK